MELPQFNRENTDPKEVERIERVRRMIIGCKRATKSAQELLESVGIEKSRRTFRRSTPNSVTFTDCFISKPLLTDYVPADEAGDDIYDYVRVGLYKFTSQKFLREYPLQLAGTRLDEPDVQERIVGCHVWLFKKIEGQADDTVVKELTLPYMGKYLNYDENLPDEFRFLHGPSDRIYSKVELLNAVLAGLKPDISVPVNPDVST